MATVEERLEALERNVEALGAAQANVSAGVDTTARKVVANLLGGVGEIYDGATKDRDSITAFKDAAASTTDATGTTGTTGAPAA